MVGIQYIRLKNKRIAFDIKLERKITIIQGDSGTGKSTLVDSANRALTDGSFKNDSSAKLFVVPNIQKDKVLELIKNESNSIILIDEVIQGLSSPEMADVINNSNNYYVIITRDRLSSIPYSIDSVYEMITIDNNVHTLKRRYNKNIDVVKPSILICEDSGSGYTLYKLIDSENNKVYTALGKDTVIDKAIQAYKNEHKSVTIIADGAAFGSQMENLIKMQKLFPISAYLPDSFEFVLLHSCIFENNLSIQNIINDPLNHIESSFASGERYFTYILNQLMNDIGISYKKSGLNRCFIDKCCETGLNCKYIIKNRSRNKLIELISKMPIDYSNIFINNKLNEKVKVKGMEYAADKVEYNK